MTTTGGYEAVVVYRWHPWFERTIEVREVIVREAEAVARCRQEGAPDGVVQELPTWMLDAGLCEAMRLAPAPRRLQRDNLDEKTYCLIPGCS